MLAGAGSGKTRVVTVRIAYLLAKGLAKAENILAVTFTNKAAAEMRERVAALIGAEAAKGLWISTFHSFCLRVLRSHAPRLGLRSNFSIYSESDQRGLWRRILRDSDLAKEQLDAGTLSALISRAKNDGHECENYEDPRGDKYGRALPELFLRYQTALRGQNALDFDDLLSLANKLFREHPDALEEYRARLRYVLVDEYQDTNPIQARIMRMLAEPRGNLCVVGDDDQSIYAFRGAAVEHILRFKKLAGKPVKRITLHRNYRSTQTILDAAGAVIAGNRDRHPKTLVAQRGPGRPLDVYHVSDEESEVQRVVERMEQIRDRVSTRWSDFAILYRSNVQSRPFEMHFRSHRIPYRVLGGQNFFERGEVKDLLAYMKVLVNERDETSLLRIVNTPCRGIGDHSLEKLVQLSVAKKTPVGRLLAEASSLETLSGPARQGVEAFRGLMTQARGMLKQGRPSRVLEKIILETDYELHLASLHKGEEALRMRLENVQGLLAGMRSYEAERPEATLLDFLQDSALLSGDDGPDKQDKDKAGGVTLLTIHSAKGLEFPFVFIVGCEEGFLPHEKSLLESGGPEEERRLFYVALTRAERHCCLLHASERTLRGRPRPRTPSRFLLEIPPHLVAAVSLVRPRVETPPRRRERRSRS